MLSFYIFPHSLFINHPIILLCCCCPSVVRTGNVHTCPWNIKCKTELGSGVSSLIVCTMPHHLEVTDWSNGEENEACDSMLMTMVAKTLHLT